MEKTLWEIWERVANRTWYLHSSFAEKVQGETAYNILRLSTVGEYRLCQLSRTISLGSCDEAWAD